MNKRSGAVKLHFASNFSIPRFFILSKWFFQGYLFRCDNILNA